MKLKIGEKTNICVWGLICGSVIAMIVVFACGGWLTESAAQEMNHEEKFKNLLASDSSEGKKTILFVCRGNIQRSVVAEMCLKKIIAEKNLQHQYEVISRGMMGTPKLPVLPGHNNLKYYNENNGRDEWEHSLPTLQELGIENELQKHRSTVVNKDVLDRASLVISMDNKCLSHPTWGLNTQFPGYGNKIMLFTELVGSSEGMTDAADAKDKTRHRKLILKINSILRQGIDKILMKLDALKSQKDAGILDLAA